MLALTACLLIQGVDSLFISGNMCVRKVSRVTYEKKKKPLLEALKEPLFEKSFENPLNCSEKKGNRMSRTMKALTQAVVAGIVVLSSVQWAVAADYGSLSPEQKAVAEAWRIVDNSFLDRTFNGQDWFEVRQDGVKKRYKSMGEAEAEIERIVSLLGDKYTRYLSPAKYQSIVDSATGTLAGVGVQISEKDGKVFVADVEAISPANKAGILPNDVFLQVDGVDISSSTTPDDVAALLRGPEGSRVGVAVERAGKTLDFILTRAKINVTTVKSYISQKAGLGKVGVVRIKNFSGTTASTLRDALKDFEKEGVKAILLDVRANPGGLLPGGIDAASLFLPQNKPLVFVVNKSGVADSRYTLTDGLDLTTPLTVFVDQNTASAAEVMTAALKENHRATVIGQRTFGKGIVQTIRPLTDNNGGLAVTVARYETPTHKDINKQGIDVDIQIQDCHDQDAAACVPATAFKPPALDL